MVLLVFVVVNIIHLYFEMYIMYKSVSSFYYSNITMMQNTMVYVSACNQ